MLHTLAIIGASALMTVVEPPQERPEGAAAAQPALHVAVRSGRDRSTVAVDPATGAVTLVPMSDGAPMVIPMPETSLSAHLLRLSAHPHRDLYVVQQADDGSEVRTTKICGMDENPRHVAWHAGWGRLIYVRGGGDAGTLRVHDPRSGEETTLPVTGVIESVRLSGNGQIGVLTTTERAGKERKASIVVFRGRAMGRAVVAGEHITSFAWSPDGSSIIYSVPGELRRHTFIGDGSPEVVRLGDLDDALSNHIAHGMAIAPDGTIALVLKFAGGRATSFGEEPKPLAGDRHIFLLNWPDQLRTIELEAQPLELHWHTTTTTTHTSR